MNGALEQEKYYTYEEWLAIDDGNRYELLNGELYMMASPSSRHQEVSFEIGRQIGTFLVGKHYRIYTAPYDVRLHKDEDTVLQPDIVVVCDRSKISKKGCDGAPDLVVEVLSPSTTRRDRLTKFSEYLRAGVQEYWVVDPVDKTVCAYRLIDKKYYAEMYSETMSAPVQTLAGCEVDLSLVFRDYDEEQ